MPTPPRIDALLGERRTFEPPADVAARALVPDADAEVSRSLADLEGYCAEVARGFEWMQPWTAVLEGSGADARWFVGARCNITESCLDRHLRTERRHKAALVWLGEDGTERVLTYAMLHREVCR